MRKIKIWKKIKNSWEARMVECRNYPIKSKGLLADLYMTALGFMLVGAFSTGGYIVYGVTGDLSYLIFGFGISILMGIISVVNFYYWTYKQVKAYESRFGKTGLGDEWLQKRQLKN